MRSAGARLFRARVTAAAVTASKASDRACAPDLSNVGTMRTAGTLQRYLLDPTDAMLPINRPVRGAARWHVVIGRRLNEDTHTVQLIDEHEQLVTLEKASLREYSVTHAATMPSFANVFDEDERADLVAYLLSLKGTN